MIRSCAPGCLLPALNLAAKVLLMALLVYGMTYIHLDRFAGKAMGARAALYPVSIIVVPIGWLLRGRQPPYPHLADLLMALPFIIDVAGNALDLYNTIVWFDDVAHAVTFMLLVLAVGASFLRLDLEPWIAAGSRSASARWHTSSGRSSSSWRCGSGPPAFSSRMRIRSVTSRLALRHRHRRTDHRLARTNPRAQDPRSPSDASRPSFRSRSAFTRGLFGENAEVDRVAHPPARGDQVMAQDALLGRADPPEGRSRGGVEGIGLELDSVRSEILECVPEKQIFALVLTAVRCQGGATQVQPISSLRLAVSMFPNRVEPTALPLARSRMRNGIEWPSRRHSSAWSM